MSKDSTEKSEDAPAEDYKITSAVEYLEDNMKVYLSIVMGDDEEFDTKSSLDTRIIYIADILAAIT